MANVEGKVVIITGGSRGMGRSHCRELAKNGAKVVVADILADEARVVAEQIGDNAMFVHLDVTKEASWTQVVQITEDRFGPITGLVNNAGIGYPTVTEDISLEEFRKFIDINQVGVFLGIRAVLPSMRRRASGGASIVNVSSTCGIRALATSIAYIASKFAVTGMSKSAAIDFGPEGIRSNSVHPGTIGGTGMLEANLAFIQPVIDKTPLRRIAKLEEVSSLIQYLISDESGYCTGAEFVVDGGITCLH